jgi:hypothetical protein
MPAGTLIRCPSGARAVEIDTETGEVSVDRYVMVDEFGQA